MKRITEHDLEKMGQVREEYLVAASIQLQADKETVEKCREKIAQTFYRYYTNHPLMGGWSEAAPYAKDKSYKFADQLIKIILE